jgi:hypothetical protein
MPGSGRPFKKGISGNPGGRPKEVAEVQKLARTHTKQAINRLVYWMKSDDPRASVAACQALLDRGWGKPTQPTEVGGPDGAPVVPVINLLGMPELPEGEINVPLALTHGRSWRA